MGAKQRIMGACGCGEEQRRADEAKKQVEEAKRAEEEANAEAMNKQKAAEEAEKQRALDAETISLNINGPDGKLDVDARLNGTLQELTEGVAHKLGLPKECGEHVEMHVSGHKLEPVTKIVREFTELWCVDEYTFEYALAGFEVNLEGIEKAKEAMKKQAAELDVYEAARDGNLADLSFVVKFAPERITPLYGDSSRGGTPLHEAAAAGQEAAVILLLSAKADLTKRDSYGDTPRKSAKDERVKQLLIDVHQAAMTGPLADLNFVVEFAPERINETNEYGGTPLHDAAGYASLEAASLLLSAKADFSKTDNYGMTALDHSKKCTYSDNEKVTQLLIDAAGQ